VGGVTAELPTFVDAQGLSDAVNGTVDKADPRVTPLLAGASAAVRRWCGWHIWPVIEDEMILDGPGGLVLTLPTLRLVGILEAEECDEPVDPADIEWSTGGQLRFGRGRRWTNRWRGIRLTVEHGFEAVPDVAQVVRQVVANALSSPMGVTREQAGAVSISWSQTAPGVSGGISLLERDLAVLEKYRLWWA
jgi:hypothetical protein